MALCSLVEMRSDDTRVKSTNMQDCRSLTVFTRRVHQFADDIEDEFELVIISRFEIGQLAGKFGMVSAISRKRTKARMIAMLTITAIGPCSTPQPPVMLKLALIGFRPSRRIQLVASCRPNLKCQFGASSLSTPAGTG
jgi:hypothetical protein